MKLKKILSGLLAGAIAVTSMIVSSVPAAAATAEEVLVFTGSVELDSDWSNDETGGLPTISYQSIAAALTEDDFTQHGNVSITVSIPSSAVADIYDTADDHKWHAQHTVFVGFQDSDGKDSSKNNKVYGGIDLYGSFTLTADTDVVVNIPMYDVVASMEAAGVTASKIINVIVGADWVTEVKVKKVSLTTLKPQLPDYVYAFDVPSGTKDNYGEITKTLVGDDETVKSATFANNDVVAAAKVNEGGIPDLILHATGASGTDPLNWLKVKSIGKFSDGYAYYDFASMKSAWVAAGGESDFSDLASIHFAGTTAGEMSVLDSVLYSSVRNVFDVEADTAVTGGTLSFSKDTAAEKAEITITAAPGDGYALVDDSVKVTKASGGTVAVTKATAANTYTFTMPADDVTVTATFKAKQAVKPATVTGGTITASPVKAAAGEAVTVTAAAADGYKYKASSVKVTKTGTETAETVVQTATGATFTMPDYDVDVTAEFEPILPTKVVVSELTAPVVIGEDPVQLTATVTPEDALNKTVTWSSSDETKATVDAATGKVTGKANGTVTITATCTADTTVSGSVTITVTDNRIECTGVTVTPETKELKVGETTKLTVALEPSDTTDASKLKWTSSDATVASVEADGTLTAVVTAKKAGTVKITADCNGKTAECAITVKDNPFANENFDKETDKTLNAKVSESADGTKYTDMGAMIIDEAQISKNAGYKVTVKATKADGSSKEIVRYVTTAYPSVKMNGIEADYSANGKYVVTLVIKNVPIAWSLDYKFDAVSELPVGAVVWANGKWDTVKENP